MDAEPLPTAPLRANPVSLTAPAQATGTTQDSPQDRRVTKVKDPQKVTAGRKGAAARKAKQEALLGQLRKAKDGLRPAGRPPGPGDCRAVQPLSGCSAINTPRRCYSSSECPADTRGKGRLSGWLGYLPSLRL